MVIGDDLPTDKPTYFERFGEKFDKTRQKTLDWLKTQELIVVPFFAGPDELGYGTLLICPKQAGFFAGCTGDLQGMIPNSQVPANFKLSGGVLFMAPPFRHHALRRQTGRRPCAHAHAWEIYALGTNPVPGPVGQKGCLLDAARAIGWRARRLDDQPLLGSRCADPVRQPADHHARGRVGRRQGRE